MRRSGLLDQYVDSTHNTLKLWRAAYFELMTGHDISPALVGPLFLLHHNQPLTASRMAKDMLVTKGAVAQFIDSLQQLGYIERQPDPHDRRVSYITLTDRGQQKVAELLEVRKTLFQSMATELSDEELEQAVHINNKVIAALSRKAKK